MFNWLSWLPENASSYGGDIDGMIALIYWWALAWLVLMMAVFGYFIIRYRRRPGRAAAYIRGESLREVSWLLVPVMVVVVLDFYIDARGAPVWAHVKTEMPDTDIVMQITASQFNWGVVYPGPDGKFGTADDRSAENDLHVPVGKPVRVMLQSKDVIHSFFLPNMRLKQDVLPGRVINAWFQATRTGKFELVCAELCGFGHSGMKAYLHVDSPEQYEEWTRKEWPTQGGGL